MNIHRPMPAHIAPLVESYIGTARRMLEGGAARLAPIAFIGNSARINEQITLPLEAVAQTKDGAAEAIRRAAYVIEADFIFMVTEAWALRQDKLLEYEAILAKYGSVEASPYRVDSVSFTLEMHEGFWACYIPIKPVGISKKKKTFDEARMLFADSGHGRFIGLLPPPRSATTKQ